MNISEENLVSWSKGPGQTEADKCSNAETAVRKAIKASERLAALDISVFAQGSYRARTNVRQNSDVDVCVRHNATFFDYYPDGMSRETVGNVPGTMAFADFKRMVQKALEDYLGKTGVTRGNKAFDVHANTYRIDADVVPTFEYRRYTGRGMPTAVIIIYPGSHLIPTQVSGSLTGRSRHTTTEWNGTLQPDGSTSG